MSCITRWSEPPFARASVECGSLRRSPPPLSDEAAFKQSVECITGPVSRTISTKGMLAVYESFDAEGKKIFEQVWRDLGLDLD